MAIRQALPVVFVDDALSSAEGPRVGGKQALASCFGGGGMQEDHVGSGANLDQLPVADLTGGHGVQVSFEGDQTVLADVPKVASGDQVGSLWHGPQGSLIAGGPHPDDLAVGGMGAGSAQGHPGGERGVHLLQRRERPPGQDVITHDRHLPFDPALPSGSVGGQDVDVEVVVPGEGDRFGVQRHRLARRDMTADHGLGPVVDDRRRDTAEMLERPAVAREE